LTAQGGPGDNANDPLPEGKPLAELIFRITWLEKLRLV
jgi:hypothetical protein